VLSLSNYASLKERLYCKPHFTQLFKEKGNLSAFGVENGGALSPAPSRTVSQSPADFARPAETPSPAPPSARASMRQEDMQSGFEPEFVIQKISKLGATKCATCNTKVFPIGKVEADGRRAGRCVAAPPAAPRAVPAAASLAVRGVGPNPERLKRPVAARQLRSLCSPPPHAPSPPQLGPSPAGRRPLLY